MCEMMQGGIKIDESGSHWAREFFDEVASARQACEREESLHRWRERCAYGGEAATEGPVSESEWASQTLEAFDKLANVQRAELRRELLEALDVVEAKYRYGVKQRAITRAFHMSNDTTYRRIAALVEYLDAIGPEQAFSAEPVERAPVGFEAPPMTRAEMLEDAGIMPAPDDLEVAIHGNH